AKGGVSMRNAARRFCRTIQPASKPPWAAAADSTPAASSRPASRGALGRPITLPIAPTREIRLNFNDIGPSRTGAWSYESIRGVANAASRPRTGRFDVLCQRADRLYRAPPLHPPAAAAINVMAQIVLGA